MYLKPIMVINRIQRCQQQTQFITHSTHSVWFRWSYMTPQSGQLSVHRIHLNNYIIQDLLFFQLGWLEEASYVCLYVCGFLFLVLSFFVGGCVGLLALRIGYGRLLMNQMYLLSNNWITKSQISILLTFLTFFIAQMQKLCWLGKD